MNKTPKLSYRFIVILFFYIGLTEAARAQERYTVSGYIQEESTGEYLIGANVYMKENLKGTTTNQYGFFSMTLEKGSYTLVVSFLGFDKAEQTIGLDKNIKLNISLKNAAILTQEVVITSEKQDKNIESAEMGRVDLTMETVKTIPVVFGEADILKTIQLLPGVQSSGEGNTGFYVRGGGADQNLVLLDEATVYNSGHLFGFFSVFNSDAIKNASLIKGGMPAKYGGRLSSVLDISMKDGNAKKFHGEGGIGLISSRLTLEGPIVKDKSSFMLSGRRTYIDVVSKPFLKNTSLGGIPYFFYDLNTKINYRFSDKDKLFLSGYFGRDIANFSFADGRIKANFNWGNSTTTLRWNHLFTNKLFMNLSAIYNSYDFKADATFDSFKTIFSSGIQDVNIKLDFDYFPAITHEIRFGINYTHHSFTPRTLEIESAEDKLNLTSDRVKKKRAHEAAIYIQDEFLLLGLVKINFGLRAGYFQQVGPFVLYTFNDLGFVNDSIVYGSGKKVAEYTGLEPRFSGRYMIDEKSSVKAGVSFNNQFVHLVSNSYTSLPIDIWVPSSVLVKPQKGVQYSAGYFRNFKNNLIESSVEVYYKDMKNQIEFNDSYTGEDITNDIEYEFAYGKGNSYGVELFVKKAKGKVQGWIGYTLSKTTRFFDNLNEGVSFPARFDRTHDFSAITTYYCNERWTFSGIFVYGTGQSVTMPERFYLIGTDMATKYGPRNGFRMESYHRMDISATLNGKKNKKFESSWTFSVYNVYNRKNPFFYYIDTTGDPIESNFKVSAKKVYIFPVLPSLTWNFKF